MDLYDPHCHELAKHFLADDDVSPEENALRMHSLAEAIQNAVDDWIEAERREPDRDPAYEKANRIFRETHGGEL